MNPIKCNKCILNFELNEMNLLLQEV